jgi:hypothetical protein
MVRLAFAVFLSTMLAGGAASASCPNDSKPKAHQAQLRQHADNCVDLNAVSQISADVVAAEPTPIVKTPTYTEPTSAKYEGPTLGMSKPDPGVKPVPTVGYHWSLE